LYNVDKIINAPTEYGLIWIKTYQSETRLTACIEGPKYQV